MQPADEFRGGSTSDGSQEVAHGALSGQFRQPAGSSFDASNVTQAAPRISIHARLPATSMTSPSRRKLEQPFSLLWAADSAPTRPTGMGL